MRELNHNIKDKEKEIVFTNNMIFELSDDGILLSDDTSKKIIKQ